jgi:hypothetical protein
MPNSVPNQISAIVPSSPGSEPERYDAFISYSRRDLVFARALERALTRYRPPRGLAVPQRSPRVFRDEDDFTGSDYVVAIRRHVAEARRLIVVCSPAARASRYVNEEIRLFATVRGSEAIIPVLIAGLANNEALPGREAEQAFPEALVEALAMPLAADYRGYDPQHPKIDRGGFEGPWHKLLADLYGVPRNEIEQREKRRRVKARRAWATAGGAMTAALAGLTIWALIARDEAIRQRQVATANESRALSALSSVALESGDSLDALKLAIAAWPRHADDLARPMLRATLDALSAAIVAPRLVAQSCATSSQFPTTGPERCHAQLKTQFFCGTRRAAPPSASHWRTQACTTSPSRATVSAWRRGLRTWCGCGTRRTALRWASR